MATSRRKLSVFIGLIISVTLLWGALRGTNLSAIGQALTHANAWFLLPLLLTYYLQLRIKSWRWVLLITPVSNVKSGQVFPSVMVGAMGSLIFPAYLSELARTYVLCRELRLEYTSVLVTIVLERMFDFLTVLAFLGFLLLFEHNLSPQFLGMGYIIGIAVILLLLGIVTYVAWPRTFQRWIMVIMKGMPSRLRPTVLAQLELATAGLQSIKRLRLLSGIVMLSLLQWIMMGICTYIAIRAFDIRAPFVAALGVVVLTVAGMTLPSAPGFFGTIQLCFTLGLKPYGVPVDMAFATSVFFHLAIYIGTIIPGIFYLRRIGYTLRALKNKVGSDRTSYDSVPLATFTDNTSDLKSGSK